MDFDLWDYVGLFFVFYFTAKISILARSREKIENFEFEKPTINFLLRVKRAIYGLFVNDDFKNSK